MKNEKLRKTVHRAMSLLLAALMVAPLGLFAPTAKAADGEVTPGSTTTKLVVWDWIDDIQALGSEVDYNISNETSYVPIEETKYSRIMFYQNTMGDRYFFNADPLAGPKSGDSRTTYEGDKIYSDTLSRVGDKSHKEWSADMVAAETAAEAAGSKIGYFDNFWSVSGYMSISQIDAQNAQSQKEANLEDAKSFITVGGERTPYIQFAPSAEVAKYYTYSTWRLWAANKDDTCSDYAICLENKYEDLAIRRTNGFNNPVTQDKNGDQISAEPWVIDKHSRSRASTDYECTHDNFVIWHYDPDSGGYNETMDFDDSGRKFKAYNPGTKTGIKEFKIFLGKEYKVSTLNENFTVHDGQITTLGRPLYYIPKGYTIEVMKDGVLTVDGVLLNDGTIKVDDGGLLIVKEGAKIMPLTKYDGNCGHIYSEGSIVIEENALLCGGASNGVVIKRGGVINFGVIATENLIINSSYAVDNRETGYILAGVSPSRAARIQMIKDAIANEGETVPMDKDKDFATLVGNGNSVTQIRDNSIFNHTENVRIVNTTLTGSASNPTLSVYTRATPNDAEAPLFVDVDLDNVSLRMDGAAAVYTVTSKGRTEEYRIQNKLVSALIARGDTQKEKLFDNLWVGSLDGAYVQIEPANAPGMRLRAVGDSNRDNIIIYNPDELNSGSQWWQIKSAGTVGENQTYYINVLKTLSGEKGLALNGANVWLYDHSSNSDNQRWVFEQESGKTYFIRNGANPDLSLTVEGGGTTRGTNVIVAANDAANDAQRWTLSLLDETGYSDAVDYGTAVEIAPVVATKMRMAMPAGAKTGQAVQIITSSPTDNAQRWRLEPAGTDTLDGVSTTFYRIVELNTGLALSVQGTSFAQNANVIAETLSSDNAMQYWYLLEAWGGGRYYIAPRGNTGFVIAGPNLENPPAGALVRLTAKTDEEYQQWEINGLPGSVTTLTGEADPLDGKTFTLESKLAPGLVAGGASPTLQTPSDSFDQQWTFTKAGVAELDGVETPYYTLEMVKNGDFMYAVEGADVAYISHIIRRADDQRQQLFAVKDADGWYTFVLRSNTDLCFTVENAGTTAGTYIRFYSRNDSDAQKWKLTEITGMDRFDGRVFTFAPPSAPDKSLDIVGNGTAVGTYVQLYDAKDTEIQRWRLVKQGEAYLNGKKHSYYTIESLYAAGKVLGVPDHASNGARAHLQAKDPTNQSQLWFAEPSTLGGYGGYTIVPKIDTTKCLTATGDNNNAQVTLAEVGSAYGGYQSWYFRETFAPEKVFTNVWLESVGAPGNGIDLNSFEQASILKLNQANADGSSHWTFEKMGVDDHGAYYRIWNHRLTDLVLEVTGTVSNVREGSTAEINVWKNGSTDQLWYLDKETDDTLGEYYYISSKQNSTYHLTVGGGTIVSGAPITLSSSKSNAARFRINEPFEPVTLGTYEIGSAAKIDMRMDPGNSGVNGSEVKLYHRSDRSAVYNVQKWRIVLRGYDLIGDTKVPYYSIDNVNSGRTLDLGGHAEEAARNGVQVTLYDYEGYSDQQYYIEPQSDGTVIFKNRANSTLVLEASGTTDNANLRVATLARKDSPAQRWQLHPVMQQNDAGQYVLPSSQAAVDAGIPFATGANLVLDPAALGRYVLTPNHSKTMRMTLKGGVNADGTAVVANTNDGSASQRWNITPVGVDFFDGQGRIYYKLTYAASVGVDSAGAATEGKVVETAGYGPVVRDANADISDYAGSYDQLWYLEQAVTAADADPAYYLVGRGTYSGSKICLEVSGGATQNNTSVQTRAMVAGRNYQTWTLEPFD